MDFTEENPLSVSSVGAAVRNNDVEAVRRSIERGRSIDLKDNRGWAAIHCAASKNYTDCLNVLLKAGADINIKTHEGETPLFLACAGNCYEAAVILLEAECLVNLPNNECVTPLHTVACRGFDKLASTLLNKQADVNAQDYGSDTPLMEAVRHQHPNICRILLSLGADQTICGSKEELPIHLACASGQLEILCVLLHHKQYTEQYLHMVVNWTDDDGFSPLMLAVQSLNLSCVEELLQCGADVNIGVCKRFGITALHLAASYGNLPILKVILNASSKETIRRSCCEWTGSLNRTNLICNALISQSEDCLAYLLDYGFESRVLNSPFEDMNPISFLFRENSKPRLLEMLLESGYDPNPQYLLDRYDYYLYTFLLNHSIKNEITETFVHKLVDHGLKIDFNYKVDSEILKYCWEDGRLPPLFVACILGGRFRLIPYLLQRSQVTEPHNVLNYIFDEVLQRSTTRDCYTLITFLSHYVDPSILFKKNSVRLRYYYTTRDDPLGSEIIYLSHSARFPSLKGMARSAIRKYIHCVCNHKEHQFKIKLNSLNVPPCLISYLNYEEMQSFYYSLENNQTRHNARMRVVDQLN